MSEHIQWIYKQFYELTHDELYDIMVLRQVVFSVEQDCVYVDADGKDQKSHHLMGYDADGTLAAYLRVVSPGVSYEEVSLGRILTAQTHRGIGLGQALMKASIRAVNRQYGQVPLRISAQTYLRRFYGSFGFEPVGAEYLEDGIPHIEMYRVGGLM